MADIIKQDAKTLSDDMHRAVVDECRARAEIPVSFAIVFALTSVTFIGGGIFAVVHTDRAVSAMILAGFMTLVSVFVGYLSFVKPRKLIRRAEARDYSYRTGRLTEKNTIHGEEITYYQLILDGGITCTCTEQSFSEAMLGDEYMAVYFGQDIPELCLRVQHKDIV